MTYAIHEASGQDVTMQDELAYSLVTSGGKPGQGFPCILEVTNESIRSNDRHNDEMGGGNNLPMILEVEEVEDEEDTYNPE